MEVRRRKCAVMLSVLLLWQTKTDQNQVRWKNSVVVVTDRWQDTQPVSPPVSGIVHVYFSVECKNIYSVNEQCLLPSQGITRYWHRLIIIFRYTLMRNTIEVAFYAVTCIPIHFVYLWDSFSTIEILWMTICIQHFPSTRARRDMRTYIPFSACLKYAALGSVSKDVLFWKKIN